MAAVARHETSGELCGYLRNVTNDSNVSRVFGFTYEEIKAAYPVELNRYAISKGISSEEVLQEHLFTEVLRVHTERLKFNPLQINRLLAPFSGKVAPTFT